MSEVQDIFYKVKIKVFAELVSCWRLWGRICSLPFPVSEGCSWLKVPLHVTFDLCFCPHISSECHLPLSLIRNLVTTSGLPT